MMALDKRHTNNTVRDTTTVTPDSPTISLTWRASKYKARSSTTGTV